MADKCLQTHNKTIKIITVKNKEKIQLYGGAAANRLGLSTKVYLYG